MAEIRVPWQGWELEEKIGQGGFGTVYSITNSFTAEKSAMKVISLPRDRGEIEALRVEGYDEDSIAGVYHKQRDRLLEEYRLMAQMKGHPNIVRCEDFTAVPHEDGPGWDIYIRMELLRPLTRYLLGKEPDEREILKIGKDLCSALVLCESKHIIHRDIKPENIFVSEYGQFKLGDFGIARMMDHTTNATHTGSYRYMAPEVYHNKAYGGNVDIYALGLVLYWLLNSRRIPFAPTDRLPTVADNETALNRRLSGEPLPEPVNGSPALKEAVLKACSYEPEERYQSAEELKAALEQAGRTAGAAPAFVTAAGPETADEGTIGVLSGAAGAGKKTGSSASAPADTDEGTISLLPGSSGPVKGKDGAGSESMDFDDGTVAVFQGERGPEIKDNGETPGEVKPGAKKGGRKRTSRAKKPKKPETGNPEVTGGQGTVSSAKGDKHLIPVEKPAKYDFSAERGSAEYPFFLTITPKEAAAGGTIECEGREVIYPAWVMDGDVYSMTDDDGKETFYEFKIDWKVDYEMRGLVISAIGLVLCGFLGPIGIPVLAVGILVLFIPFINLKRYGKKAKAQRDKNPGRKS